MKKYLLTISVFALTLLVVPSIVSAAVVAKPPSNRGLIGYWNFNEGTGTIAGDSSGRSNKGTLTNNPLWIAGKYDRGLWFNGNDSYVSIPTTAASTTAGTISFWAYATTTQVTGYMVATSGTVQRIYFNYNSNNTMTFTLGSVPNGISTGVIPLNTWYHVVGTWSGSTGTLYVNNQSIGTFAFTTLTSVQNPMFVGSFSGAQGFNGILDDVRFYNRTLSASEISTIYSAGSAELKAASNLGLKGLWSFDEGSGTLAGDSSGSGVGAIPYPGTAGTNTATSSMWVSGKKGTALSFDGTDDRAFMTPSTNLNGATKFTWAGWVYFNDVVNHSVGSCPFGGQMIYQRGSSGSFNGYIYFGLSSGVVGFDIEDAVTALHTNTQTTALQAGRWYHIAAVADTSNFLLYVNGVAGTPVSYNGMYPLMTAGSIVGNRTQFGECDYTAAQGPTGFFNGKLDDVHVYNRALNASEIRTLFNAGGTAVNVPQTDKLTSGLVGFWSFNGKDVVNGVIKDRSGLGNDGNPVNISTTTFYTSGKVGQAANFGGVNTRVTISNESTYDFTSDFSVSLWLKVPNDGDTVFRGILGKYDASASGWDMSICNTCIGGRLRMTLRGTSNLDTGGANSVDLRDGTWHHAVAVNTTSSIKLYIDGQLIQTTSGTWTPTTNNIPLSLGDRWSTNSGTGYSGKLDEVRIYNRQLSATEVKQLYLLGK